MLPWGLDQIYGINQYSNLGVSFPTNPNNKDGTPAGYKMPNNTDSLYTQRIMQMSDKGSGTTQYIPKNKYGILLHQTINDISMKKIDILHLMKLVMLKPGMIFLMPSMNCIHFYTSTDNISNRIADQLVLNQHLLFASFFVIFQMGKRKERRGKGG